MLSKQAYCRGFLQDWLFGLGMHSWNVYFFSWEIDVAICFHDKNQSFCSELWKFICNLSFQAEQILKDKASVGLTQRATFLKVNSNISIRVKGTIVIIPDTFLYLKVSNE